MIEYKPNQRKSMCSWLWRHYFGFYFIVLLIVLPSEQKNLGPDQCICLRGKNSNDCQKLKCGGGDQKIANISALKIDFTFSNFSHLDLSMNDIRRLISTFLSIPSLEKLDVSKNKIDFIEPNAFQNLTNLRRLDLSNNRLLYTKKYMFESLLLLEKLKLNENLITKIYIGSFDFLYSLKQLDLSDNHLQCDCDIKWLSDWSRNTTVKLTRPAKCESPTSLRGQSLKKIRLNCTKYEQSSNLELKPVNNQVVFEGDSLKLECRSLSIGSLGGENKDAKVVWSWRDKDPATHFQEIKIENFSFDEYGYVESHVNIEHILRDHSGNWNCHLLSEQGNHTRTLSVIVISDDTQYCPQTATGNNKGIYFWPKTVVGFTVELPCEGEQLTNLGHRTQYKAYHTCTEVGEWDKLNTSQCPYISETTKILEQFSKLNLSIDKKSVLENAKRLRNFTGDGKLLTDGMDVAFIAKTIENYLIFVSTEKELGSVLIDIMAAILRLPRKILHLAQFENFACSKMVASIEIIAEHTPSLQSHKANLAVEEFRVAKESFSGITCNWYTNPQNSKNSGKFFHCSTSNKSALLGTSEKVIEASIQIPSSLFYQIEMQGKTTHAVEQLLITMYENNHFFPRIFKGGIDDTKDVTSCIVGSKLVGFEVSNLTDPVYIMLRAPVLVHSTSPQPVWWDLSMGNGTGGWNHEGCNLSQFLHGLIGFYCDRLGYFGLLQDTHYLHEYSGRYMGAKFRLCHPAIYIGSFILLVCLIVSTVTYAISHTNIQMSRRAKHALVNTWIAISLLCFMFSFGIYQTEEMKTCQGIGLILHYFSLSTLLWMSVAASHMYKRLAKTDTLDHTAEDDLPPDEPIQKPILGLYLVGWGIGLIVCGISGAVNLREYAGRSFCFLGSGPALSAVFVPAGMLLLFLFVFYLLTLCAIRNNDMNGQLSEGTQGTENVDLELLEVPLNNSCTERRSIQSIITPTDSDDIEDPEHSPIVQLKAQIIVLFLYLFAWLSAADSISKTFSENIPYEEDIFSTLYCVVTIILGTFILYFYCVARSDVRAQWYLISKLCKANGNHCCRTRNISDTLSPLPVANPTVPVRNGTHYTVPTLSSSSINSSGVTHKSNSHNSNRVKAAKKLNTPNGLGEPVVMHSKTTNSVNLVVMHRQIYRSNNSMPTYHEISGPDCAEAFYNPHQSIVARKFFRKQKRNHRNDLGLRRRGDGGGTSDGGVSQEPRPWRPSAESAVFLSSDMENASENLGSNLFGHGSKVNNTNLHVGKTSRHKRIRSSRDPNILTNSEGEDDKKETKLPIERLVIGAEEDIPMSGIAKNTDSPRSLTPDCNLSRVDEVSVSEEVNSTAVNMSEMSECQQRMDEVSHLKDVDTTDDDYSNEVCEDITLTCPDYRTVELQCSLGENSCSDLNSEINFCDGTTNDEFTYRSNCCLEKEICPLDCCSKTENISYFTKKTSVSQSSSFSLSDENKDTTLSVCQLRRAKDSNQDEPPVNIMETCEYDSFHQKIDNLRFSSKNTSHETSTCYESDHEQNKSESPIGKSPPKYVTVLDPQFGMVKVTLGEYKESAHRLSLAQDELIEDESHGEPKTETSV